MKSMICKKKLYKKWKMRKLFYLTDYLNKNSNGNLFILIHYLHSVSNFRPLGLSQETNIWIYVVSYISICLSQPVNINQGLSYPAQNDLNSADCAIKQYGKDFNMNTQINV